MKVPKRYQGALFSTLMGSTMALLMSFTLTGINTGFFDPGFWGRWMGAFLVSLVVSIPTAVLVAPVIRRIVAALSEE